LLLVEVLVEVEGSKAVLVEEVLEVIEQRLFHFLFQLTTL
jgi:hypothetical protein